MGSPADNSWSSSSPKSSASTAARDSKPPGKFPHTVRETPLRRSRSREYLDRDRKIAVEAPLQRSRSNGDLDLDFSRKETSALMEDDALEILRREGPLNTFEEEELLHLAAAEGSVQHIELLFQRVDQAKTNLLNAKGKSWPAWTALHYGAANNNEGVLKLLLDQPGIGVDEIDNKGNTALLIASGRGHSSAVKILLQHRAEIRIWNNKGKNCLTRAASKGHADVVKTLLEFLKDQRMPAANGLPVHAEFRFIQFNDNMPPKWTALHHAAAYSRLEVLEVLLQNPHIGTVDVQDDDESTPLIIASERGHEEVVTMLLAHASVNKAKPLLRNSKGWNCLHAAAFEGNDGVVKILLDDSGSRRGKDTRDANGNTPLMLAARKGHKRVLETLMLFQADVWVQNIERSTFLHMAVDGSHRSIIKLISNLLLYMPQDIRMELINARRGELGNTALIIACEKGNEEAVGMLLSAGADPLICNEDQYSCVHMAAKGGHYGVLKLLLKENEQIEESQNVPLSCEDLQTEWAESFGPEFPLLVGPTSTRRREVSFLRMMERRCSTTELTALHMAAQGNHLRVVLQLMKAYLTLVLKIHGFTRHPRDHNSYSLKFLHEILFSYTVANKYEMSKEQASGDSLQKRGPHIGPPLNADPKKLKNRFYNLQGEDYISKIENHDEIRKALTQYWTSLESSLGARDWRKVISENFSTKKGEEKYFVEKFVDGHMRLIDYANSKDSCGRTFLHYIADEKMPCDHGTESSPTEDCLIRAVLGVVSLDVNASDFKEETPLHLAIQRGNRCVFRHCLVPGRILNLTAKNCRGESVVDLAFHKSGLYDAELDLNDVYVDPQSIKKFDRKPQAFKELEKILIERFLGTNVAVLAAEPNHDIRAARVYLETLGPLLRSMKERVSHQQVSQTELEDHGKLMEAFVKENHYDGLTLLHYIAFRGLSQGMEGVLNWEAYRRVLNRPCKINMWTPLHYAVQGGHKGLVELFLSQKSQARTTEKDKWGETPLGIAITRKAEFRKKDDLMFRAFKAIEGRLLKDPDVIEYTTKLRSDRQVLADASNAILVGAAVIASVTFAGWLQPPLGYVDYHLFSDPSPPQGSTESFAAIARYRAVQIFWVFNSLSFFFAVATVICGAGAVVQATGSSTYYIRNEVRLMRLWLRMTSTLLAISIICVLGAFAAAGFAVLPPSTKYRTTMIVTASLGIPTCVICLLCLFSFSRVLGVGRESLPLFSRLRKLYGISGI